MRRSRRGTGKHLALIPAIFGATAAADLFLSPHGSAGQPALVAVQNDLAAGNYGQAGGDLVYGLKEGLLDPAFWGLVAGAAITGWVGKKFRLGSATKITKHVSVM
jgi:hypothetical protein